MTEQMNRAADVLARRLYEAGCRYAFGMPGGEVLTVLDAFERAGIEFILIKHENAGGFMAEGVWHETGAPGILLATIGPGATNALNVAANSEQDRVPLIIITGCIDAAEQETYIHQVVDHQALFRPVCKASFMLTASAAGAAADKAVNIALENRMGPVHIDVPIAVAATEGVADYAYRRAPIEASRPAEGPGLEKARGWLAEADRPILIAGYDAVQDGSSDEVRAFAEQLGIPVLTTYKAKGVLPEDHELSISSLALSPTADGHIKPLVEQSDLIILAGYDPIELRTGWRDMWDPAEQRVIEFSSVPNDHYVYHAGLSFIGPVGEGLKALGEGAKANGVWSNGAPRAARGGLANAFGQQDEWGPGAIVDEVRKATPREAMATIDTGAHRIVAAQVWESYKPRSLLQSVGLGTMGCAVPLAAGAKLAKRDRPVVAMTGDAGLLMVLGEFGTLSDLELPIVIVVFVDRSLALIEIKQRQRELANRGVDFKGDYDYAALAEAFGGKGYKVKTRSELKAALDTAFSDNRFSLVACEFDRQAYDGIL